jgi:hypothetical protein
MEITFDRASKFYEPGEKVTGKASLVNADFGIRITDLKSMTMKVESYMDTVSEIRGKQGTPPMDPSERIYFMKQKVEWKEVHGKIRDRTFEFVLEGNVEGEKLIDAYCGVEFSIIYKVSLDCICKLNQKRHVEGAFYVKCPGAGIDPTLGKSLKPQSFEITHASLESATTKTIPKFKFDGQITSVNCCFSDPFDGYIIKRHSELQIKSVEI